MTAMPKKLDERTKQLFAAALDRSAGERAEFLARACAGDDALLAELRTLLRNHELAQQRFADGLMPPPVEQAGDRIGHYRLRQRIGEGGFGHVWMAEQEEPVRRRVALKVLKAGMDTAQVIGRFEAERQALALMDHPNIAKVFDGGATPGGRPYFVMELVNGVPITRYCDEAGLDTRERLDLFVPVCQAVQHAHQKGIIHRDLKPSNVLVTLHDGRPVPKVIDFGIAKATEGRLTDKTVFTEFRQMLGTPEYMAPEQAALSNTDVDTRADVYSLGVLLYELLTGTRPFELQPLLQIGYAEMLRTIREVDPPKPSTRVSTLGEQLAAVARQRNVHPRGLGALIRGDLDWIVMKALEKERSRRYDTVTALAEDVLRHLRNEPVLAGPPSRLYRLRKYLRRHRAGAVAVAAIATTLVAGATAAMLGYVEASDQRSAALVARADERQQKHAALAAKADAQREAAKSTRIVLLLSRMLGGSSPFLRKGKDYTVRQLLDDFAREHAGGLPAEPEVGAKLHAVMGKCYRDLGLPAEAEHHSRRALELWAPILPATNPDVAGARLNLAGALLDLDRFSTAMAGYSELRDTATGAGDVGLSVLALQGLADCCRRLARYAEARDHLQDALRLLAACPTGEPVRSAIVVEPIDPQAWRGTMLAALGTVAWEMGGSREQLEEAGRLLAEGLALQRATLAAGDDRITDSLNSLALVFEALGRLPEAVGLLEEVLARDLDLWGEDHQTVAATRCNLADVLRELGELDRAEPLYRAALQCNRRVLGEHLETARAANGLGVLLQRRQDFAAAEPLVREALSIRRTLLGEHPAVARAMANLGTVLQGMRRDAEARELIEQALAMRRNLLGEVHEDVAHSLSMLAALEWRSGDLGRSVQLARERLAIEREIRRESHPRLARALTALAIYLETAGELDEAESLASEAVAMLTGLLDAAHPEQAQPRVVLAKVELARGDRAAAEAMLRSCLEILGRHFADSHGEVSEVLQYLARALLQGDAAQVAEAADLLSRLERAHASRLPADHPYRCVLHTLRGLLLFREGRLAEAEQSLRVAVQVQANPNRPLEGAEARAHLGITLVALGRHADAQPFLEAALEVGAHARVPPPWLPGCCTAMVQACEAAGQTAAAERWREVARRAGGRPR